MDYKLLALALAKCVFFIFCQLRNIETVISAAMGVNQSKTKDENRADVIQEEIFTDEVMY